MFLNRLVKKINNKSLILIFITFILISCDSKTHKITYSPNSKYGLDASVLQKFPVDFFHEQIDLRLSSKTEKNSMDNLSRFFLKIRCNSIPIGSKIDSAFIYLTFIDSQKIGKNDFMTIHRVVEEWEIDSLNWNNQPKVAEKEKIKIKIGMGKFAHLKLNVTSFIKTITKTRQNYGLRFKLGNEEYPYKSVSFYSNNAREIDNRPKLVVYYK